MNAENNIGNTIRQLRKKHGLSAKQLYEGLCSASKFSKIEAGDEYPKEMLLKALMERMGELPPVKCLPLSDVDYDFANTRKELTAQYNFKDFDSDVYLRGLVNHESKMSNLEKQEYFFYQAVYLQRKNDLEASLNKAIDAVRISYPDFAIDCDISSHLFTRTEISIINNIAITLEMSNRMEEAVKLLSKVESYLYSHFMTNKKYAHCYVVIVNNLAGWVGMQGKLDESLRLSQRGLEYCKRYNELSFLPVLLYTYGYISYRLGKTEEGKKCIQQSCVLLMSLNKESIIQEFSQDVIESFGEKCWKEIETEIF